ncbi:hypothetical protein Pfo_031654, partial [Paulownia fortunei]
AIRRQAIRRGGTAPPPRPGHGARVAPPDGPGRGRRATQRPPRRRTASGTPASVGSVSPARMQPPRPRPRPSPRPRARAAGQRARRTTPRRRGRRGALDVQGLRHAGRRPAPVARRLGGLARWTAAVPGPSTRSTAGRHGSPPQRPPRHAPSAPGRPGAAAPGPPRTHRRRRARRHRRARRPGPRRRRPPRRGHRARRRGRTERERRIRMAVSAGTDDTRSSWAAAPRGAG